jgi:hypothetical protein
MFAWHNKREDLCETMKELELPCKILKEVRKDGTPSMIGKKIGLMGRIRQEMNKQSPQFYMKLHCIIYQ